MLKEFNAASLCSPVSEDSRPANNSTVSSNIKLTSVLSSSWLVTKLANSFGGPGLDTVVTKFSAVSINALNSS